MKRLLARPLGPPLVALAAQLAATLVLWTLAELAYGDIERRLPAALERPLSLTALAVAGPAALTLLAVGLQRLHVRAPAVRALLWTALLYPVPLLVAGAGTWMLLVLA